MTSLRRYLHYAHPITAVGTLFLAGVTAWLAWNASLQIHIMQNDQRPWIKVEVKPIDFFRFRPDGSGTLPLEITLSNVGKSPAFNIQPEGWGFLFSDKHNDIVHEQRAKCDEYPKQRGDNSASMSVLFPGETVVWHEYGGTVAAGFTNKQLMENHTLNNDRKVEIYFWVYGCVDYMFSNMKEHHQTPFIYQVARLTKRDDGIVNFTFGIEPAGEIPAENLKFFAAPNASGKTY